MTSRIRLTAALLAILGLVAVAGCTTTVQEAPSYPIEGVWSVTASGAPFAPHLFTFAVGNTMLATNPTNVQQSSTAPHGGTNDSVGMGTWQYLGQNHYRGTFHELNAWADNHHPAATLTVTFTVSINGDQLSGLAEATQDGQTHPTTLTGTRL